METEGVMAFDLQSTASTMATPAPEPDRLTAPIAFSGQIASGWEEKAGDRLVELLKLSPGWDGHLAAKVSRTLVDYACNLLPRLVTPGTPLPFIAPLASGELQLEWHRNGWDLEIEIHAPGQLYAYVRELATGIEWECHLADDLSELGPKLAAIRG
jgi:hypothetical protein